MSACLLLPVLAPAAGAGLKVGEPAPPLEVSQWVKGGPVNLAEGRGRNVYVVEFWATWCPPCVRSIPHLSALQAKYQAQGVVVIGVSDEPPATVVPFVRRMGERMAYAVACDAKQAAWRAYMQAVGERSIPHAFVIDKQGKLAWHGNPGQGLEQVLTGVLAGNFDSLRPPEGNRAFLTAWAELQTLTRAQRWEEALAKVEDINRLQPDPVAYHLLRFRCLGARGDEVPARAEAERFLAAAKDAEVLNAFAWDAVSNTRYGGRYKGLGLAAAEKATKASAGGSWNILDTCARARFETGDVGGAIELQRRAVDLAQRIDPRAVAGLRKTLEAYLAAGAASR